MTTFTEPLELMGVPGSPYTRKMLALLRYKRLNYRLIPGSRWKVKNDSARYIKRAEPKVRLLPTFYGRDDTGDEVAVCDSTPLIRQFDKTFPDRAVIPSNPSLALVNSIIEDYADEWLTKAMFHYRWKYAADIEKAGQMLPRWNNITAPDSIMDEKAKEISALQISRLRYVGSNDITRETIENSYIRILRILDKHLTNWPFLLGNRPASSDFAIYGQLTCLALFDPTPQALVIKHAPRVYAWTEVLEDLSGYEILDSDWGDENTNLKSLTEVLSPLLSEISDIYIPYLVANKDAVSAASKTMNTTLDGREWEQQPFPYQVKCLQALTDEFNELSQADRKDFDEIASATDIVSSLS